MKKIIYTFAVALLMLACNDEEYNSAFREYAGIRTTGVPTSVLEDSGTTVSIPVYYGGTVSNGTSFTVSYTVTGGTYGTDYTIEGGTSANGTVTIATGETGKVALGTIKIKPVADIKPESSVVLVITLNEASNGVNIGYPYQPSYKLTLADDDCAFEAATWKGTFAAIEDYNDGSPYGPYDVTFNQDTTDPNKYVFDNFWDSGITAYVVYDPTTNVVTFPAQTDAASRPITGQGTYAQCTKTFTIKTTYRGYTWDYKFTKK